MAMELMKKITMEVLMKYSDVMKVSIVHIKGWVPVSNASFMVAVSGGHRCDAHSAVLDIVNQVKARVPIWKKIIYQEKGKDQEQEEKETSQKGLTLTLQNVTTNENGQSVKDELIRRQEILNMNKSSNSFLETESASVQPDTPLSHWSTSSEAFWRKTIIK